VNNRKVVLFYTHTHTHTLQIGEEEIIFWDLDQNADDPKNLINCSSPKAYPSQKL